jgi:hypothetical protein
MSQIIIDLYVQSSRNGRGESPNFTSKRFFMSGPFCQGESPNLKSCIFHANCSLSQDKDICNLN